MIKELEDYHWFPERLRRYQMDYIGSLVNWLHIYRPLVPVLQQMIDEGGPLMIQDTASGSGIPAIYMQQQVKGIVKTQLSDKYPDKTFRDTAQVMYIQEPVDLVLLEPSPGTCYTLYNGLHHFSAREQTTLVKKLVAGKNRFLFAEILQPGIFIMIKIILTTTLLQLLTAPFIRPFSLIRLFFTYIIPVNLFTALYDGVISVVKSASISHYRDLLIPLSTIDYSISVTRYSNWKGAVICITGNPLNQ